MSEKTVINKIFGSRLFWIIASLILSILLWMYVTTTEGTEREVNFSGIKVDFVGEETMRDSLGLIVTNVENNSVAVRISANRRTISKLSNTNITAQIDLSTVSRTGLMQWPYTLSLPKGVTANDITIVSQSPQVISFTVDKLSSKTVELRGKFEGTVAEGYIAESMEFTPNTVIINGPEAEISKVAYAMVVINRDDVDRSITIDTTYSLMDADGNVFTHEAIELETETVSVTLPVISEKEVPLSVNILSGGGATSENCKISISPETIMLAGHAEILDGVNKIDLGTIDLSEIESSSWEGPFAIVIPNDTTNLTGTSEAIVSIEIRGLETKKFTLTNFSCINVADGYTAQVVTQNLDVDIRGRADVLDLISGNNLRAVADLTGYGSNTGVVYLNVKIHVDGFSDADAGAVGTYKAYVSIEAD